MSANAEKRGFKRVCIECGNRFYDLNKRPIICPACSTEFSVEEKIKPRRAVAAKKEEPAKAEGQVAEKTEAETSKDEELEEEDDGVEVVSLDDLATTEGSEDEDDVGINIDLDDDNLDDLDEMDVDMDTGPNPDDELDEDLDKE